MPYGRRDRLRSTITVLGDLVIAILVVFLAYWFWQSDWEVGPRIIVGLVSILVVPGYALTAALFVGNKQRATDTTGQLGSYSLSPLERAVFSVGLSVLIVPLLLFGLEFTTLGIRPRFMLLSVLGTVLLCSSVACIRRLRIEPRHRFGLPLSGVGSRLQSAWADAARVDLVIAVLLVMSVAVAGSALAMTDPGETFTEFYLLSEDETGELVADGYPSTIGPNSSETLHVGIVNQELQSMEYTVVVELQSLEGVDGNQSVVSRTELDRYTTTLRPGESTRTEHRISPPESLAGQEVRLTFALYTESLTDRPDLSEAYRRTHLWIDVSADGEGL